MTDRERTDMLKELYVKHFVLIDEERIIFGDGLNIVTGETGAGKSVLLGALAQVLGGRADTDLIMHGAQRATIEAVFTCDEPELRTALETDYGIESDDGLLVLRRQITAEGRSRCFANGISLTLTTLKALGSRLVDIHGQHQHQALLDDTCHIEFLDHFGGYTSQLHRTGEAYANVLVIQNELNALRAVEKERDERRDLYAFQYRELCEANLEEGEYGGLENELSRLENAERLEGLAGSIADTVSQDDDAIVTRLGTVERMLQELSGLDASMGELGEYCESARVNLEELADAVQRYADGITVDPERLDDVRERTRVLERIMKKYGGSEAAAIARRDELENMTLSGEDAAYKIEKLEKKAAAATDKLADACTRLSAARKKAAKKLTAKVTAELQSVGMQDAQFKTAVSLRESTGGAVTVGGKTVRADADGCDNVVFQIAANPGQPLRPLAKVASGGEISRVMLVLKDILAEGDRVPTMVFDEIDVGISGRIAQVVGERMSQLGKRRQVVCITHLPQIASYAASHFSVRKVRSGKRALIRIVPLNTVERETEVASLLDGKETGATSLQHARELIRRSSVG